MKGPRYLSALILASLLLIGTTGVAYAAPEGGADPPPLALVLYALAFLLPVGLLLVAWGGIPPERGGTVAPLGLLALGLALVGYLATGFAFQFGGAAFLTDDPGLAALVRYWSPVRGTEGLNWGMIGLEGFFLSGPVATPQALALFLSQLPLVMTAVLVPLLALPAGVRPLLRVVTGLGVAALTYPLVGNWGLGGGWLANLGRTMQLGHGLVDFGGVGTLFLLSGATALSAGLAFRSPPEGRPYEGRHREGRRADSGPPMPPAHLPLLANLGLFLALVGWLALGAANPLYADRPGLHWPLIALNGLTGLAGGALITQLYSWFTTARLDPLMAPRGGVAGLVAIAPAAPFLPTWSAFLVGAMAGLIFPVLLYVLEENLGLPDEAASLATYGGAALWGLLAVGLLASGHYGVGWNGVGLQEFAGVPGQGVTGYLAAPGFRADGGQFTAQLVGVAAIGGLGFLVPWGLFALRRLITRRPASQPHQSTTPSS